MDMRYNYGSDFVELYPKGNSFHECIEVLKEMKSRYNPEKKTWELSVMRIKELFDELNPLGISVDVSDEVKTAVRVYLRDLKQQKFSETKLEYIPNLMNFQPLKGKAPFENYQIEDTLKAMNTNRMLFKWDVGLGKSWATTCLIEHGRHYKKFNKVLLFSSTIGIWNLKNELMKFSTTLKEEEIGVYTSLKEVKYEDRDLFNLEKYGHSIIIMSYEVFKGISNFYYDKAKGAAKNPKPSKTAKYTKSCMPIKEWGEGQEVGLFLDECHLLSDSKSRRSQIFNQNLDTFYYRYLFSATPYDNYVHLYSTCRLLDKYLTKGLSPSEWLAEYNDLGTFASPYAVNPNGWKMDKINRLVDVLSQSYVLARDRFTVLDLPEDYEYPTFDIPMTKKQREIYETFITETVQATAEGRSTVSASSTLLNKFQFMQIALDNPKALLNSPNLDCYSEELIEKINKFDMQKDFKKFEVIDDLLETHIDEQKEKGIIWYYRPATLEELKIRYAKYKPYIISSDVPLAERLKVIDQYKQDSKAKLLILSIPCANTSVTVTCATWQVYAETVYSYKEYYQSRGRISRNGQTKTTTTYHICYSDSLDWVKQRSLSSKGQIVDGLGKKPYISGNTWKKLLNATSSTDFEASN